MRRAGAVLTLLGLAAAGLSAPAGAQERVLPPNLAGLWTFEADIQPFCRFNGQARLAPTSDPRRFDCELTAEQDCPAADVRYVVTQTCSVSVEDRIATVDSTIVTFLEGEPTANYLPDDFQLVVEDPALMRGVLLGTGAYAAEWRRAEGAIS